MEPHGFLFVGGPYDGKKVQLNAAWSKPDTLIGINSNSKPDIINGYWYPISQIYRVQSIKGDQCPTNPYVEFEEINYKAIQLRREDSEGKMNCYFIFMAEDCLFDPIAMLLDGYRQPNE